MEESAKSQIIAPRQRRVAANVRVPKPFLELAQGDPRVLNRIVDRFTTILRRSLSRDRVPSGHITANIIKERFAILERWYRALRNEKKWGVTRILDSLPDALHAELNGQTWQPDKRTCWIPSDGQ